MANENLCEKCSEKKSCQDIYKQLGQAKGPSVVLRAIVAFVVPIVFFIASLAACDLVLAKSIEAKELRIALGFLIALVITFAAVRAVRVCFLRLSQRPAKQKENGK
jgi:hypothetical protein